ncbi:neuronal acetylcholine receptor subunit alpha-10-like [Rhopilema esculentum]|uniref:neuronal acetylcholine receptor subunit alpha-10-like n=1 Tax=Rhopilema esculentum TaxID=499914 RepID=UPI0031D86C55
MFSLTWWNEHITSLLISIALLAITVNADAPTECTNARFKNKGTKARTEEQRLLKDLLCNYDKEARPVLEYNDSVIVTFEMKLIQVVLVSEKDQKMQTNVWITQTWENPLLAWNESEYNGISQINLDADAVWVPTIILYNNAEDTFSGGRMKYKTKVILEANGKNTWFAAVSFKSSCKFDVRNFPFDEQECRLTFGSWAYTSDKLKLRPAKMKGDMSDYIQNGEWEIVDIPVEGRDRKYACCQKAFSEVIYKFQMRRKVLYYLFNLILPCSIIATLAVLAFCINPRSGQRITLSITVMLAMSVFLNFAWTRLPVTSESVPLLAKYYMITMSEIGLSLFANCVSLNYFYRDDALNYLPRFCRVNFIAWLAKVIAPIFCMEHPRAGSHLSKIVKEYTEDDTVSRDYVPHGVVNEEGEIRGSHHYETVVTIADSHDNSRVKVSQLVKRQRLQKPFKRIFMHDVLANTSTHALTAEPQEHYKAFREYRKCREEDDLDVLIGNKVELALLQELEDHKQFAAAIMDRFFLLIFLLTIALSVTALMSGDTAKYA